MIIDEPSWASSDEREMLSPAFETDEERKLNSMEFNPVLVERFFKNNASVRANNPRSTSNEQL